MAALRRVSSKAVGEQKSAQPFDAVRHQSALGATHREAERLEEAARSDYEPFLNFARASGQRYKECLLLKWSDVDWDQRLITTKGKGGRTIIIPITPSIATILWPPARSPPGARLHLHRSTPPGQPREGTTVSPYGQRCEVTVASNSR